ncbi:MAG TPA: non-ribosomal peptide synthetase [Thermomonospora sp.]|nr:non-ribosomal peptide synthetase [Thermomonospora sp.]
MPQSLSLLLERAARDSGRGVTFVDGPRRSYAELLESARRVLGGLRARGLAPGDRVVAVLDAPEDFVPVFWGAVLGGFVPCPVAPIRTDMVRWRTHLEHVNTLLDGPLVVVSKNGQAELPRVDGLRTALLEDLADAEPDTDVHRGGPDDLALLMLTSGSTGHAKAVRLTQANLLAALRGKAGALSVTADDVMMGWISFDHIAAIEGHLLPLWAGGDQVVAEPQAVLGDPLRFVDLLAEHRVTLTFTPNFLFGQINQALADRRPEPGADLSAVRHIISGGEAVVSATVRRFLDGLAPYGLREDVVVPAFGMTETCAGSVFSLDFATTGRETEFAPVGRPVEGLRLRIVAEDGTVLPDDSGEAGELQLRGPMVTDGYFNDEEVTRAAFTEDGWFRTGDLGRLDDGRLTLVGRSKDSIIVNGVNYFSHELETLLQDLDGVRRGQVAAFPIRPSGSDSEQLAIVFAPTAEDDASLYRTIVAIRNSTVLRWGFRPSLILPVDVADIPRGNLGKVQRSALRRRVESGGFAERAERVEELVRRQLGGHVAPEGEAETALAEVYARVLGVEPAAVSATVSFFDLGGTSLDVLRLKLETQRRFGIRDLPVAAILQAPTVRLLAARVADGGAARAYDPLVPLQVTGDRTPLFCVHPGLGEVLVFVNLAKYFVNERPFYALRARGFGEGEEHFGSFAEMVGCYVDAIRRVQPEGPYAVAGYSYGGAVAFEIAKSLEALGERVDFVGIFNLPPHIRGRMNEITVTDGAVNLALFLSLVSQEEAAVLPDRMRELGLTTQEQLAYLIEGAPARRLEELDLNLDRFAAWVDLAQSMVHLGRDYEPGGTVESVRVFYCEPLRGTKQDWLDLQLRAWDGFTRSGNRYIEVDGEHYTLMSPEHVQTFQATLRRELAEALGER